MRAYCLKCRCEREMNNPKPIKMRNGRPATEGTCSKCGTKVSKLGDR